VKKLNDCFFSGGTTTWAGNNTATYTQAMHPDNQFCKYRFDVIVDASLSSSAFEFYAYRCGWVRLMQPST
jgi:hypothetical protein